MAKVIKPNNTSRLMHIGAVTIPPHESREVDERDLPGYRASKPAASPESVQIDLDAVLERPVREVLSALDAVSDDELRKLRESEMTGKGRAGVLSGIEALLLKRAAEGEGDGE